MLLELGGWTVFARPSESTSRDGRTVGAFTARDGRSYPMIEDESGALQVPFELEEAYANYLAEAWTAASRHRRVASWQLAGFYRVKRFVPRAAQLAARRALVRWQGTPSFPAWPLDDGVNRLLKLHAARLASPETGGATAFRWFWPLDHRAALILSHDVESSEGVRLALELADLEESLGFRSAFNFGAWYEVDPGVLRELTSRGFEVGMHGIVHDRSLFSSRSDFEGQLPQLRALAERLGAVGFRSPATHRVHRWLAELPVEYDGTIPHSDPYEPQPGGCCSLWPFFVGNVVELPYTLPQDHTLLTLLGHRTPALWIETADEVAERHGLIHCISHPDRGYLGDRDRRTIYAEFLRAMRERTGVWHALPKDVAAWWRARDTGEHDDRTRNGRIVADGDGPTEVRFEAPAATRS